MHACFYAFVPLAMLLTGSPAEAAAVTSAASETDHVIVECKHCLSVILWSFSSHTSTMQANSSSADILTSLPKKRSSRHDELRTADVLLCFSATFIQTLVWLVLVRSL